MTVVVSFVQPASRGSASGIYKCRVREDVTIPGTTTEKARAGEMIVIGNAETSMVAAAWGTSSPDAAVNGMPIAAGDVSYPISAEPGDVVNIKAVS